jgi:triacylglycerol lipase
MAKFAEIAYLDGAEAQSFFKGEGFRKHVFLENDGAQCHVIWNDKEVVLCFRGTEPGEFSDIKADLNALPDRANNGHGWVHNGFQEEVNKIWEAILEQLEPHADKDLYITGHSLGGAMATIATSRLGDRVKCLYTFGSPRAGTRSFVNSFSHIPHYRFVNNNDVVPKVPFAFLGYRHQVSPAYINYYGNIRPATYWQRVKDQWRGRWRALKKGQPFDGAYDHGMTYYCKYTEQCK